MQAKRRNDYESKKQGDRNQIIVNNLSGSNQCRVSNAQLIENDSLYYTVISGNIDNNSAVQSIGNEFYLDVNPRINKAGTKIDTLKREHDAWFPVRHRTVQSERSVSFHRQFFTKKSASSRCRQGNGKKPSQKEEKQECLCEIRVWLCEL